MPDEFDRFSDHRLDGVVTIVIAIRSRENDNAKLHDYSQTIRYSSMTGFVRTSFASLSTCLAISVFELDVKDFPLPHVGDIGEPERCQAPVDRHSLGSRTVGFKVTITVAFMQILTV